MTDKLMTIGEVAGYLRISIRQIRRYTSEQLIPVVKIGKRTLFDPESIRRFVKCNTVIERRPIRRRVD